MSFFYILEGNARQSAIPQVLPFPTLSASRGVPSKVAAEEPVDRHVSGANANSC